MFPNLRLMIVAVVASMLGISCALGLFAEFRVSHDSFLRESNATAPMQLGANDAAPARVVNTAMPFEFRFQAPPDAPEPAGSSVISEHEAAVATAPVAPPAVAAPETALSPASPISPASIPEAPPINSPAPEPVSSASPADSVSQSPVSAATASFAGQNTRQGAKPGTADNVAARTPAAAVPLAAPDAVPETQIAPEGTNSSAPSRSAHTTPRRRPLIVYRLRRLRPAAPGQSIRQSFSVTQPGFQWAAPSGLEPPQTVRRRVIFRRVRPARPQAKQQAKQPIAPTASPQTAVSNTSPVNPPEYRP